MRNWPRLHLGTVCIYTGCRWYIRGRRAHQSPAHVRPRSHPSMQALYRPESRRAVRLFSSKNRPRLPLVLSEMQRHVLRRRTSIASAAWTGGLGIP